VTLTGTAFTGATAVRFGTTAATSFTVVSPTQITAVAPAGTGTVQVTVASPGGTSSQAVMFTYVAASVPTLTAVVPGQGPASGGNTVTLSGTNLSAVTQVLFGGTAASSFTVVSATQITAVVPPGIEGSVAVTVSTPGGTTSPSVPGSFFYYLGLPVLSGVVPAFGPTSGGNTVTLTGTKLLAASAVRFGATAATSFTVVSSTEITAVVPAGTGAVQVTVTTPGGTSNPVAYVYATAPVLTGIVPNQGPTAGGITVTLTGTGLTLATAVTFGVTPAAFTVVSDTQLTAVVPAGGAGPVTATVTTPGGTSNGLSYVRVPPPNV
jgi:hypothetical protein